MRLLVEEARNGLIAKDVGRLWVLLQVQPSIFDPSAPDIFTRLTRLLAFASISDLEDRICNQCESLADSMEYRMTIQNDIPPFFCVLDDVQVVSDFEGEFMSQDNETERPILREIWTSWSNMLRPRWMPLVISGTGIELQVLQDPLVSNFLKPLGYHRTTETGGFDDRTAQATYIQRYVPKDREDLNWDAFFFRAWDWLHGWYRS